jgi:hypothetical protein
MPADKGVTKQTLYLYMLGKDIGGKRAARIEKIWNKTAKLRTIKETVWEYDKEGYEDMKKPEVVKMDDKEHNEKEEEHKDDKKASIKKADFMEPVLYEGDFVAIDGINGTEWVDKEYVSDKQIKQWQDEINKNGEVDIKDNNFVSPGKAWSVEVIHGFGAYMSAPGYMDRTDLTVFDTEEEAQEYLNDIKAEDEFEPE